MLQSPIIIVGIELYFSADHCGGSRGGGFDGCCCSCCLHLFIVSNYFGVFVFVIFNLLSAAVVRLVSRAVGG